MAWLQNHAVDLAILDIRMPEMDGFSLARAIREQSSSTAILFVTSHPEYAAEAWEIHPTGFVIKPLTEKRLAEEVEYAEQWRASRASFSRRPRVEVRTFGNFDLIVEGKKISFPRSKAKELLASVQGVVADMNAQIGDRYLFSGQSDTTMPFRISDGKKTRCETKTLSDNQAKFFSNVGETGSVSQMVKLKDQNDGSIYYWNVKDGNIYTEDFVENGYRDKESVVDCEVGTTTAGPISNYFDEYGVQKSSGAPVSIDATIEGKAVKLDIATTEQYVVYYEGDAKYISMVKKTGGIDQATDTVNQTGQDVFGSDIFDYGNTPASGTAMLNELLYAVAKIDSADNLWAANDGLTISDAAHSQVLGSQTTMAARQQAYTAASDMLTTQDESITSDITDVSSTDVAKLATMLMEYQTIYSLSLSVGSKILPGTLADYLH